MIKKIAILGSTGSIGKTTLKIIEKDKKNFKIELLTTKGNYKLLLNQAKKFKVKNIIITDKKKYQIALSKKIKSIKIYNDFNKFDKIFPRKLDYVMSSIVGLDGLMPTINIIKHTKTIAIANKESILCAWNLIKKNLDLHKTNFIPVDSEHFSIWYALKNYSNLSVNKIFLTASGGSLLNKSKSKIKNIKISDILNHPNWKMGKKITVDSSTMMNKVFEIIEAKKIFNLSYSQLGILIHPKSYIHSIIKFNDGMIKIIAHDTTMEIPIFNSIYNDTKKNIDSDKINIKKLNELNLGKINFKKYPSVKFLKFLPSKDSLFETALVTINDELVNLFLQGKIKYSSIIKKMNKMLNHTDIKKLKKKLPTNVSNVINTSKFVRTLMNLPKLNYEKKIF